MMKILIILMTIFSSSLFAERANFLDLNQFLKEDSESFNDMAQLSFTSTIDETTPVDKAVNVEVYFGEYDQTLQGRKKLEYIQEIIALDQKTDPNFKLSTIAISTEAETLENSKELDFFLDSFKIQKKDIQIEQLPQFLDYVSEVKNKNKNRIPSAKMSGKTFWTLVRGTSAAGGTFAGLYFMEGLTAPLAATISIMPAIGSASLSYFSAPLGNFFTSGRWSTWLIESDHKLAKKLRAAFKITPETIEAGLDKNKAFLKRMYPEVTIDIAKRRITQLIKSKKLAGLKNIEQYFKWWLTEVAFTAMAIKLPQAIAGIGQNASLLGISGDILMGSTLGLMAQGPGDIAIQLRKYQKVKELREAIVLGKIQVDDSKALVAEIDKVLDKTGVHKAYNIHDASHPRLVKIENWARSRGTLLSFFSVAGVGMDIAGVPIAKPMLIGIGAWGATYYANVQGWFKPSKILDSTKAFLLKVKDNGLKHFSLGSIQLRKCGGNFLK